MAGRWTCGRGRVNCCRWSAARSAGARSARELIGLVPGGIGLLVKGSVAYAGTYTVGKAAAIYYSTGQTLTGERLKQLYRDALKDAGARVRPLLPRRKSAQAR